MDLKTVFSLFVAVVMVGSIVGFTVFYQFPDQDSSGNGGADPVPATSLDFFAEGVEAVVSDMLPSIRIMAETLDTDVIAVNNSVYGIEGIKRVSNGRFQQYPYTNLGAGYVYAADISFDVSLSSEEILEKLEAETSLQFIEGGKYALVEVPEVISMKSVNEELGLEKDYEFSERITEAIVDFEALEGDVLSVTVQGVLVGIQMTNVFVVENENLTAAPVQKTVLIEAPVSFLEDRLLFNAEIPFSLLEGTSSLEEELNEIPGILDANVFVSSTDSILSISFEEEAEESALSDFKTFVEGLGAELIEADEQNYSVSFEAEISAAEFSEKMLGIESKLLELGLVASVEESKGFLAGQAQLDSAENKIASNALRALLESRVLEIDLTQPGWLELEEITDSDDSYAVPEAIVNVSLQSGHSLGETVQVEATLVIVRGVIESVQATE